MAEGDLSLLVFQKLQQAASCKMRSKMGRGLIVMVFQIDESANVAGTSP
jgi:hypothetical protein